MASFTPYGKINSTRRLGDSVFVLYFCSEAPNTENPCRAMPRTTAIVDKKLWSLKYGSMLSSLVTSMVPKTKAHPMDAQLVAVEAQS